MGKLTISMVIFNSKLLNYQRVSYSVDAEIRADPMAFFRPEVEPPPGRESSCGGRAGGSGGRRGQVRCGAAERGAADGGKDGKKRWKGRLIMKNVILWE